MDEEGKDMGRHRRSAAGRAATGRATGVTQTHGSDTDGHDSWASYQDGQDSWNAYQNGQDSWSSYQNGQDSWNAYQDGPDTLGIAPYLNPQAYADTVARSQEYLYSTAEDGYGAAAFGADGFTPDGGGRGGPGGRRRKKKAATPVKAGLLGVSAAVALGTVAVATGVVPGLESYRLGGGTGPGDNVQAADTPSNSSSEQGGTSGSAETGRAGTSTSRDAGRSASASPSPSASKSSASASPSKTAEKKPEVTPSEEPEASASKSKTATKAPQKSESAVTVSAEAQAAAEVLKLVNEERAKVGCSALSANSALSDLAEKFSDDMAARGFFDHTDPDGKSPWDRAEKAGISSLGGENIARGQADAAAVMEAWMNSPGHKANILNCDFKTLGVGVHFGSGGPWWTQDFGY
ncbi:CAP domain-containing protein [Streptomyces sp. T028]|uniref:CAP domain-containing protein n=1 Tax=Streptomyces sp. T028 TaxID=3394379 RepID=UPI003A88B1E3